MQLMTATNEPRTPTGSPSSCGRPWTGTPPSPSGSPRRAIPVMDPGYKAKLRPYVEKYKVELDGMLKRNPYGVPIGTGGWAGNSQVIGWATANYHLHKAYPDLVGTGPRHPRARLPLRHAPGAQPLVRLRRREPLQAPGLRQQPRGLLVHRGRRRARRAGAEARLPGEHGRLAVPLGRERVRDRHRRELHLPRERRAGAARHSRMGSMRAPVSAGASLCAAALVLALAVLSPAAAAEATARWPWWRGPLGNGVEPRRRSAGPLEREGERPLQGADRRRRPRRRRSCGAIGSSCCRP